MRKTTTLFFFVMMLYSSYSANYAYDLTSSGNNYLQLANAPLTGNSSFTIECWFNNNNNTYTNYARIIGFSGFDGVEIGLNAGNLVVYDGAWRTTNAINLDNGWHHVSVTNNTTDMFVYVDGIQVYTKASKVFDFTNIGMSIGSTYSGGNNNCLHAYFDEVRVWNVAKPLSAINADRSKQLKGNESNLVVYYQFNNLLDNKSGGTNNLTLIGSGNYKRFDFGSYLIDYCLSFDGTDDYCELSANNNIGTGDFTIEIQFKPNQISGASGYQRIIGWDNFKTELALRDGILAFYNGVVWIETIATNLNDNKWHHLAITKKSNSIKIILDNGEIYEKNSSLNLSGKTYFGGNPTGANPSGSYLRCNLDEIRIWNFARTREQLATFSDSTIIGNEQGLISYFDMNTPIGTVKNLITNAAVLDRNGNTGNNNLPQYIGSSIKLFPPTIFNIDSLKVCSGNSIISTNSWTTNPTINWYLTSTGGSILNTGPNFNISLVHYQNIVYYLDVTANGVKTAYRVPINIESLALPDIDINYSSNNSVLTVDELSATYQWVNCANNTLITNANQRSYTPTVSGDYKVIVTKSNGCKDTSECTNVTVNNSSVNNLNNYNYKFYPNPFDNILNIDNVNLSIKSMILYDQLGRKLIELNINKHLNQIDLSLLNSGIYTLELISTQGESIKNKIIKN